MKVKVAGHLEKVSGAHGDLVYVQKSNGTCYARQRPCKRRRMSEDQLQTQAFTSRASAGWSLLTDAQREDWRQCALQKMVRDREGRLVTPNAVAMYIRANRTRQILGLPLLTEAPTSDEPSPISDFDVVHTDAQRAVTLRVNHSHTEETLSDLVVMARMAPPPITDARKFMPGDYRYICRMTPQSAQSLPPSGEVVTFSPVQFDVPPGKRYRIELRIARVSDGLLSRLVEKEFVKPA